MLHVHGGLCSGANFVVSGTFVDGQPERSHIVLGRQVLTGTWIGRGVHQGVVQIQDERQFGPLPPGDRGRDIGRRGAGGGARRARAHAGGSEGNVAAPPGDAVDPSAAQ